MICDLCDKSILRARDAAVLRISQPDGGTFGLSHVTCARERGFFCDLHEEGHVGFSNGETTCPACVIELAAHFLERGVEFVSDVRGSLPSEDLETLGDLLGVGSPAACLGRFVRVLAAYALVSRISVPAAVRKIRQARSMDPLIPFLLAA